MIWAWLWFHLMNSQFNPLRHYRLFIPFHYIKIQNYERETCPSQLIDRDFSLYYNNVHLGIKMDETRKWKDDWTFHYFYPRVPAVIGFKPLNLRSRINHPTNCVTTTGILYSTLLKNLKESKPIDFLSWVKFTLMFSYSCGLCFKHAIIMILRS